jgi:hypothetical protein
MEAGVPSKYCDHCPVSAFHDVLARWASSAC